MINNLTVTTENIPHLRQIRSLLTDAARLTGQLRQQEIMNVGSSTPLNTELALSEYTIDILRQKLFDLQ